VEHRLSLLLEHIGRKGGTWDDLPAGPVGGGGGGAAASGAIKCQMIFELTVLSDNWKQGKRPDSHS
jgi:hypothetical protein